MGGVDEGMDGGSMGGRGDGGMEGEHKVSGVDERMKGRSMEGGGA